MGFVDNFVADVWAQRKMVAQYPPAGSVRVGDVLEKRDGIWQLHSRLPSAGFKPRLARGPVGPVVLQSKGNKTLRVKAKGKSPAGAFTNVLGKAEAGVSIEFTGKFGYLMSLADVSETEMTNVDELLSFIRAKKRWVWDLEWVFVTSVYDAKSATILTTGTSGATAVLKAAAELKPGGVKVADLSAGFTFAGGSSIEDKYVCESKFTPLYRGRRVKLRELVFGSTDENRKVLRDTSLEVFLLKTNGVKDATGMELTIEDFDPTQ